MMNMSEMIKTLNESVVVDQERLVFDQVYRSMITIVEVTEKFEMGDMELPAFAQITTDPCQFLIAKEPEILAVVQAGGKNSEYALELLFLCYRALGTVAKRQKLLSDAKFMLQKAFDLLDSSKKSDYVAMLLDTLLFLMSVISTMLGEGNLVDSNELKLVMDTCDSLIQPLLALNEESMDKLLHRFEGYEVLLGSIKTSYMYESNEDLPNAAKNALIRDYYWYKRFYALNMEADILKATEYEVLHMKHLLKYTLPCYPYKVVADCLDLVRKCCSIKAMRQSHYICNALIAFYNEYDDELEDCKLHVTCSVDLAFLTHYFTLVDDYLEAYAGPFDPMFIEFEELDIKIYDTLPDNPCTDYAVARELFQRCTNLVKKIQQESDNFLWFNDPQLPLIVNKLIALSDRFNN